MDGCVYVRECIWMIHYFVVPSNLCMHTIPNVSPNPTPLSGDLSVLATFIQLKVINFYGCELVTGWCGGGGGRGEWVTYRDFNLGWRCIVYHTQSKTLSTHTLASGNLSALAALINLVEFLLLTPSPHTFNQVRSWRSRSARS